MERSIVFFFLALLAVPTVTSAQEMMIGLRGGVDLASQKWNDPGNTQSISIKPGILAGGQFDYPFNRSWAADIQVLFDQKGAYYHSTDGPYNQDTAAWTTSYIEIPLLAKWSFGNSTARPYLFAGPSVGFRMSNIEKLHTYRSTFIPNGVGVLYAVDTTADISDSSSKIDFSVIAGAGVSFILSSGMQLFLDATYAFGLKNIDNYFWDTAYGISMYSRDIRLAAGIMFPLN